MLPPALELVPLLPPVVELDADGGTTSILP
jgi:hypothetical protein